LDSKSLTAGAKVSVSRMPWAPVTIRSISSAASWLARTAMSRTSRSRVSWIDAMK
jgi:hypothetical protein